jgi:hypothetical protein
MKLILLLFTLGDVILLLLLVGRLPQKTNALLPKVSPPRELLALVFICIGPPSTVSLLTMMLSAKTAIIMVVLLVLTVEHSSLNARIAKNPN